MDAPINLPGRFAVKLLDGGTLSHVEAYADQGRAIDVAEQTRGARVFVIDTQKRGTVVWDSADVPEVGIRTVAK